MQEPSIEDLAKSACQRCYKRKARCDRILPKCTSCLKSINQCVYDPADPTTRRQDVEKLERRLRQLEARNDALTQQLRDAHAENTNRTGSSHTASGNEEATRVHITNDAAVQAPFKTLNSSTEKHYLGSASGLLLASLLQSDSRARSQGRYDEDLYNGSKHFGATSSIQSLPDVDTLPSEQLAKDLLTQYLAHDHLCYPFLNPHKLVEIFGFVYSKNDFYKTHPVEAFTVDMCLAVATAQVSKFSWVVMPDAETHQDRAMCRLGTVMANGGVVALQAILLICQYRMGSGLSDASASLWHLIGIAARLCFEIGLHRESYYTTDDSEMKRRSFWCVVAFDRIASTTLGRPLAVGLEEFDTELPRYETTVVLSPDNNLSPGEPIGSPQWHLRTAIFVHIIRYRIICGKILTSLHNIIKSRRIDTQHVQQDLFQELEKWHLDTKTLPLGQSLLDTDRSSFRTIEWYELLYHNGILMLYRPSQVSKDILSQTLQRIFDASRKAIGIYAYLHKTRRINYSYVTLHAAFIAGVSYIYAVRCHLHSIRSTSSFGARLSTDPTISQIVGDTRACSNVLVAVSERWSSARNAYQVLGKLSDALIADVVDLQAHGNIEIAATSRPDLVLEIPTPELDDASLNFLDFNYQPSFDDLQSLWGTDFNSSGMIQISQDWLFDTQTFDQ